MTTFLNYPSNLPGVLISSDSSTDLARFSRTDVQIGAPIIEMRHASGPSFFRVGWSYSQIEYQLFETWFNDEIAFGSLSFNIDLIVGLGLVSQECYFNGPYTRTVKRGRIHITASLIVGEKSGIPEIVGPFDINEVHSGVVTAVTISEDNAWWSRVSAEGQRYDLHTAVVTNMTNSIIDSLNTSYMHYGTDGRLYEIKAQDYRVSSDGVAWITKNGPNENGALNQSFPDTSNSFSYGVVFRPGSNAIRRTGLGQDYFGGDQYAYPSGDGSIYDVAPDEKAIIIHELDVRLGNTVATTSISTTISTLGQSSFRFDQFACVAESSGLVTFTRNAGTSWSTHDFGEGVLIEGEDNLGYVVIVSVTGKVWFTEDQFSTVTLQTTIAGSDGTINTRRKLGLYNRKAIVGFNSKVYLIENLQQ